MSASRFIRRFLVPRWGISLYYFIKYGCRVSTRAEVDLSPLLQLGRRSEIGSFTKIKATYGPLRIGRNCSIGSGCFISSGTGGLEIGDDCLISPRVTILANNYNYRSMDVPIAAAGMLIQGRAHRGQCLDRQRRLHPRRLPHRSRASSSPPIRWFPATFPPTPSCRATRPRSFSPAAESVHFSAARNAFPLPGGAAGPRPGPGRPGSAISRSAASRLWRLNRLEKKSDCCGERVMLMKIGLAAMK